MNLENLSNSDIEFLIDNWVNGRHAERNRKIMKRRLIDGICFEPLAEEFELSVRQVKSIVYKYSDIIFNVKHVEKKRIFIPEPSTV